MPRTISKIPPRLIYLGAGILLLVVAVHLAGVALLRYQAEKVLHPALPRGTSIAEAHVNLFTGLLEVRGFELRRDGLQRIRIGSLYLDISPWRLLRGEIHVEQAELDRVYLRIERLADGTFDLGLPPFGADQPTQADGPTLALTVDGAALRRATIQFSDAGLASELVVSELTVGGFSAPGDAQQVPLTWDLRWDGEPIAGNALVNLSDSQVHAAGELSTGLLDLGRAQRLARQELGLDGRIGFDGRFDWDGKKLALAGTLQAPELAYAIDERQVKLGGARIPGFALELQTEPAIAVQFEAPSGSHVETWITELEGQQVQGRALDVSGAVHYRPEKVAVSDANYHFQEVSWQSGARGVKASGVRITGDLEQSLAGDTPFPAVDGAVTAARVQYADSEATLDITLQDLQLQDLGLSQLDEAGKRQLSGRLSLAGSQLQQGATSVAWSSVAADLNGYVGKAGVDIRTDLEIVDSRVSDPALPHGPLQLARLQAQDLALGEAVQFATLRFGDIQVPGQPSETGLEIAELEFLKGRYSAQDGLSLDQILVGGLQTALIRDKSGRWQYPLAPAADESAEAPATAQGAAATDTGKPLAWRIGGVQISGDSHVTVTDRLNPDSTSPRIAIETLRVGELRSSAPNTDTPIKILLRPDEYSEFEIDGVARPLADPLYLQAEGRLHGIGLSSFNGFIANDLGHRFLRGQLDNDYRISIENNHLEMTNALALAQVEAEAIPNKEGPPLGTAIALLEDRDGNIKLDVPVSGDLDDPQFRVLGALNPIIMKAVAGTAALAIQPLGSVLLVGSLVADQALKVTFEPALFQPGSSDLDAKSRDYLAQLGAKLKEKPKLGLRFCGVATEAERKKDKKGAYLDTEADMLALAQERAEAVKTYLAGQDVGEKQLRLCRPELETQAEARPRVEIKL